MIGWQEKIRVATGIDVWKNEVFVTDFYGNRLLVYDFSGDLLRAYEGPFDKPTEVMVADNKLYVTNYGTNEVVVLR